MNVMKKLTIILALLLVCGAFIGAASAASAGISEGKVSPSGSLTPGQTVAGSLKISIPAGTLDISDWIKFSSPVEGMRWSIKVFKYDADAGATNEATTVSGTSTSRDPFKPSLFGLVYEKQDVTLQVSFSGIVQDSLKGTTINVVTVECNDGKIGEWKSDSQKVYNPSDIKSEISRINTEITALEKRIAEYDTLGVDTKSATQYLGTAKTNIASASANSGNVATAFSYIESADKAITNGERALANAGLTAANTNIGIVNSAAATLAERGWNNEALYLKSDANLLASEQKSLAAEYNAGGNPNANSVDTVVKNSFSLVEQANQYLEDSKGLPIGKILPFIIGGVVIAAIVAAVVVIVRKRSSRWDELG